MKLIWISREIYCHFLLILGKKVLPSGSLKLFNFRWWPRSLKFLFEFCSGNGDGINKFWGAVFLVVCQFVFWANKNGSHFFLRVADLSPHNFFSLFLSNLLLLLLCLDFYLCLIGGIGSRRLSDETIGSRVVAQFWQHLYRSRSHVR